ncbi:MAG: Uncharacterised protein [Candidatus Poseidoniaceae archaeon]|nr:MAG: Uncharacterised protein [Candidatus Poseidoniaceae archaeon]
METNQTCIAVLEERWVCFLTSLVGLLKKFLEANSDLCGVCVEYWSVSDGDSLWNVHELDLTDEGLIVTDEGWFTVRVSSDVTTADVDSCETTDVETNVVAWLSLVDHCVVHLDRLDLSGLLGRVEDNGLTSVQSSGFDLTDWDSTDTRDLVDVLDR